MAQRRTCGRLKFLVELLIAEALRCEAGASFLAVVSRVNFSVVMVEFSSSRLVLANRNFYNVSSSFAYLSSLSGRGGIGRRARFRF